MIEDGGDGAGVRVKPRASRQSTGPNGAARAPRRIVNKELLAERQDQLVAAATELFLRQGFHKTSIREIADAAGWHMGTLYLYIRQKEDVLYLITRAHMKKLTEDLWAMEPGGSARETLAAAMEFLFRAVDDQRRQVRLMYRESQSLRPEHLEELKDSELRDRELFVGLIEDGVAAGEFRRVDPHLVAHDILVMAHSWALKSWALLPHITLDAYIEQQKALVFWQLDPSPAAPTCG